MGCNIAICDDSSADRQYIADMVNKWAEQSGKAVFLTMFPSAENFLFRYRDKSDYDILLLDIEMGGMDGVSMAKELRRVDDAVQIIFITGYSDYISEGYDVAALHYLMKPVREEKLFSVLDRAAEKLLKNERMLTFEVGGEMLRVPVFRIRYAEVYGNYYGTPKQKVLDRLNAGEDILLEIDTQGALNVMKAMPEGLFIFLLPPSLEELANRLKGRGTETEESLQRRLGAAVDEIKIAHNYRYVVVNDKVEAAEKAIAGIIEAEHHRTDLNEELLAGLQQWKENA